MVLMFLTTTWPLMATPTRAEAGAKKKYNEKRLGFLKALSKNGNKKTPNLTALNVPFYRLSEVLNYY